MQVIGTQTFGNHYCAYLCHSWLLVRPLNATIAYTSAAVATAKQSQRDDVTLKQSYDSITVPCSFPRCWWSLLAAPFLPSASPSTRAAFARICWVSSSLLPERPQQPCFQLIDIAQNNMTEKVIKPSTSLRLSTWDERRSPCATALELEPASPNPSHQVLVL